MRLGYLQLGVCVTLSALVLFGQETRGTIAGRVTDPQSSAIAGASITVTNLDTKTTFRRTTNDTGYYEANLLLPGRYEVIAEAPGFKRTVRGSVALALGARVGIDLRLEIGALTERILVTSEAPVLETAAVSSGRVLDNRNVMGLPAQNKNTILLVRFTPGIQSNGINEVASVYNTSNLDLSGLVAGRVGGHEWSMDGMPNLDRARRVIEQPFTDIVEEFKVETSAFDASIGHTLGASVSMKTKSGTNSLHGSLSELHWQQRWQGTRFFVRQLYYRRIAEAEAAGDGKLAGALRSRDKQPSGHSNNYAATIGGPVVIPKIYDGRNRLFFFFSFNGLRDFQSPPASRINRTVPTLANRQGDFSNLLAIDAVRYQIHDPLSVRPDPARPSHYIRDPIPGNVLPASRLMNPGYGAYERLLPAPNNDPLNPRQEPLNNYLAVGTPTRSFYKSFTNRIDYLPSEKHRLFGRWGWRKPFEPGGDWTYESAPGLHDVAYTRTNKNAVVDWVYVPGPSTVLDFALSANESMRKYAFTVPFEYKPSEVGLPAYVDEKAGALASLPVMTFAGYETLGQFPRPVEFGRTLSTKAEISHVRGRHSLRAGFDGRQAFVVGGGAGNTSGNFAFSNAFTRRYDDTFSPAGNLGHSWAAFMMGLPNTLSIATSDTFAVHSPYYGWFVQDSWRVTSKLTLNLGLRAEFEQGPTERFNRAIGYFQAGAKLPITDAAQAAYARNPLPELDASNFAVLGGSTYLGSGGASRRQIKSELMWLPRIAAAYQATPRTVLRAGYGLFFDPIDVLALNPDQNGFSRTTSTNVTNDFGVTWLAGDPRNGASPLRDPFPVRGDGTRFDMPVRDGLGLMAVAGRGFAFTDYNMRHTRQQRWRVGFQRQFGADMVLEAAYAGFYTDRVPLSRNVNALPAQYWADGLVRNDALANSLNSNVANPFQLSSFADVKTSNPLVYHDMSTQGFFTSGTIRRNQLLRPFPHMTDLTNRTDSIGKVRSHGLEVSFEKRFSRGFNLNLAYTGLRLREADFLYNEFDGAPPWRLSNDGRPHRFLATTVFEPPFGKGRALANSGWSSWLFGGFQISLTYEYQPGPLLDWGNLFYYGDVADIQAGSRTLDGWFNTADFERAAARGPAAFHRRVFPTRVDGIRADMTNQWDANVARNFRIRERVDLQLRVDALNLQNRSHFAPPNVNPTSTDFGRVTSTTDAMKRFIQIQARILF